MRQKPRALCICVLLLIVLCVLYGFTAMAIEQELRITRFNPESSETKRFRLAHPDIPVVSVDMGYQLTPALISQLISGNDVDTDIYMVRTFEAGYSALLKKGFCSSLTTNEGIYSSIEKMPNQLSSALFYNNELLAVPVEIEFDAWTAFECSTAVLDEIGIKKQDIPTNMIDLLDKLISWYEDGTLYGIRLFDGAASEQPYIITWFALNNYTYSILADSEQLNYDTTLFKKLMEKCDILCSTLNQHAEITDSSPFLFRRASPATLLTSDNTSDRAFMPIVSVDGMKECYPAYLTVAIQNPLSQNKEVGQYYLEAILHDLPIETQLFFWPELVQSRERVGYQDDYQLACNEIKRLQTMLDENIIDEAHRAESQALLEELKQWIVVLERKDRWELSPEVIESCEHISDYIFIPSSSVRELLDETLIASVRQYSNHQIDMHVLIDLIIRKSKLMQQE